MRPRFVVSVDLDPEEGLRRITGELGCAECPVDGMVAGNHVDLMIPKADRRFWSPRLSLEFTPAESSVRVRGLYGPRPAVWTMFAMFYCALAFVAMMGAIFGYSQWVIDQRPWALWSLPATLVLALGAYATSLVGQRLALEEMQFLHRYAKQRLGIELPSPYAC
jgi:hypothetical protein